jgi:hypothetical protein
MLEGKQLARAEPEWRHGVLDPAARPARQLRDQKTRRRCRASVGSGRSHYEKRASPQSHTNGTRRKT